MQYNVLLVDDQALVRSGICSLLSLSDCVCVVGECADGEEALAWIAESPDINVDIVLMDIRMPRLDGIATLHEMNAKNITLPVLMLTTFDDHALILNAVQAGAKGYLLKDVSLETLIQAIKDVVDGKTYIQPAITERLLSGLPSTTPSQETTTLVEALSEKEREILRLMAAGCSNREIAHSIHKSEGTVKNQVSSILAKLGVRDRTRAVLKSIELGII
ncbi:response regulator [Alteromonas facilis]|uniref:response regulator n=1 Tax=Alteromonas facilis TaxID=2048004 RepID=UPI000C285099|nr:response regulator transcription factor [Alteromonas facilis]